MSFTSGSCAFGYFDADSQFQVDADKIVEYTRRKLGDPVMTVHLSSSQIYNSFEEATLEYSSIVNQYQAKSLMSQFLGAPTGSLQGSEQKYPARLLEFQKKMAEPYGEEAGLNGIHTLHSASIMLVTNQQKYDLQVLLGLTGSDQRISVKEVFHYSPLSAYRFFGTTSAVNYLNNQFGFESFTPETVFYLLPIWEDVLRGMQFKMSNNVRRSHYSYEIHNNILSIFPTPSQDHVLWFNYMLPPNPTTAPDANDSQYFGVSNLSNIPFGVITYSKINSIGKHWIRRFAFALAKETEGHIRGKMNTIPIPNGDLTLNGPELMADARQDQDALRTELKEIMEEMTYDKLATREAEMATLLEQSLKTIPMGIYVGSLCIGFSWLFFEKLVQFAT